MDTPLAQCNSEEQHAVVRFLWSAGLPGAKITNDSSHNMETMRYRKKGYLSNLIVRC